MALPKSIGPDSVVRVSSNQVYSRLGDEVAILELDRGVYCGPNDTGSFLWNLMRKPVRVNEMRAALIEELRLDDESIEQDLLRVLGDLRDAGLIEHLELG